MLSLDFRPAVDVCLTVFDLILYATLPIRGIRSLTPCLAHATRLFVRSTLCKGHQSMQETGPKVGTEEEGALVVFSPIATAVRADRTPTLRDWSQAEDFRSNWQVTNN